MSVKCDTILHLKDSEFCSDVEENKFTVYFYDTKNLAMPWQGKLVAILRRWIPHFCPRPVSVGFEVDRVALGQVFVRVRWFPCTPTSIISP